jgi:hypothetical protein
MSNTKRFFASLTLGAALCFAAPALAQPQLTIQGEEAAHANIVAAIREMKGALKHLQEAPHDFGGNKAAAMADTQKAIHSLKKALYYRLKMDDAAIDKIQ